MDRLAVRIGLLAVLVAAAAGLLVIVRGAAQTALVVLLAVVIVGCVIGLVITFWPRKKVGPRLVFRDPSIEPRTVGTTMPSFDEHIRSVSGISMPVTGFSTTSFDYYEEVRAESAQRTRVWCIYALIANDPLVLVSDESNDALNVLATLRFTDPKTGHLITEKGGRWSDQPQGGSPEATQRPAMIDVPGNGGAFKLDIAIKYWVDSECYFHNDESRFTSPGLRDVALGPDPVLVEIKLQGSGVSATAVYLLAHFGVGDEAPTLTRVS